MGRVQGRTNKHKRTESCGNLPAYVVQDHQNSVFFHETQWAEQGKFATVAASGLRLLSQTRM
ncbi:hypothetical protein DUE52_06270 [Larkinella punicea]|uniref:Uncharacterized protein n=1 Tax=Larkinella punicea TaxID=2315727 RepID=A0A368JWH2_9BACT|nr:hypothetical protein DUE52_06270 [Larkinella punicea]